MEERLYYNLEHYFPSIARQTISYTVTDENELVVDLRNGTRVLYDDFDKTIRQLPMDGALSEEVCRREFAMRLRTRMNRRGINQGELAERTGISRISLSNYMNCKSTPSFYQVQKIAEALGCSTDALRCIK